MDLINKKGTTRNMYLVGRASPWDTSAISHRDQPSMHVCIHRHKSHTSRRREGGWLVSMFVWCAWCWSWWNQADPADARQRHTCASDGTLQSSSSSSSSVVATPIIECATAEEERWWWWSRRFVRIRQPGGVTNWFPEAQKGRKSGLFLNQTKAYASDRTNDRQVDNGGNNNSKSSKKDGISHH